MRDSSQITLDYNNFCRECAVREQFIGQLEQFVTGWLGDLRKELTAVREGGLASGSVELQVISSPTSVICEESERIDDQDHDVLEKPASLTTSYDVSPCTKSVDFGDRELYHETSNIISLPQVPIIPIAQSTVIPCRKKLDGRGEPCPFPPQQNGWFPPAVTMDEQCVNRRSGNPGGSTETIDEQFPEELAMCNDMGTTEILGSSVAVTSQHHLTSRNTATIKLELSDTDQDDLANQNVPNEQDCRWLAESSTSTGYSTNQQMTGNEIEDPGSLLIGQSSARRMCEEDQMNHDVHNHNESHSRSRDPTSTNDETDPISRLSVMESGQSCSSLSDFKFPCEQFENIHHDSMVKKEIIQFAEPFGLEGVVACNQLSSPAIRLAGEESEHQQPANHSTANIDEEQFDWSGSAPVEQDSLSNHSSLLDNRPAVQHCVNSFPKVNYSQYITKLDKNSCGRGGGLRRLQCNFCGFVSGNHTSICQHVRNQHLKLQKWQCLLCPKAFDRKLRLDNHLRKRHPGGQGHSGGTIM